MQIKELLKSLVQKNVVLYDFGKDFLLLKSALRRFKDMGYLMSKGTVKQYSFVLLVDKNKQDNKTLLLEHGGLFSVYRVEGMAETVQENMSSGKTIRLLESFLAK